ncbi:Valacyclovir hydrolase [Halotydeus destructor]|nr:Valacyclovir hydrolase [Halotydeus destructor]
MLSSSRYVNRPVLLLFRQQCAKLSAKVQVDGINLHYEKVGHGPENVLLLPGALGTARSDFAPQLDNLNKDKFTLISWDPPGYGNSRPPERNFDDYYRKDASLAAKMMSTLGINKYSVLGWSDGGITGLIMAADNVQSVNKLAIWGANAYVTDHDRKCVEAIRHTSNWSDKARQPMEAIYGVEGLTKLCASFCDAYVKYDDICKGDIKQISCPVFILHGDQDPMVDPEHVDYFMANINNVQLHRWPAGKHNIHLRYAKEFNELIEQFLSR